MVKNSNNLSRGLGQLYCPFDMKSSKEKFGDLKLMLHSLATL